MSFNLATILTETALATPDALVCRFGETATTYGGLDERSGRFAAGLREAGLGPGDVVALQLPNLPHFLITYFGALKAGMVLLPLNPLLMAPELEYHLGDSSATMLVGFEGMHAEAVKACERLGLPLYLASTGDGSLPDGARPASALLRGSALDPPGGDVVPRGPEDTAVLVYTSGTTGKPKGAELTHFQLYMKPLPLQPRLPRVVRTWLQAALGSTGCSTFPVRRSSFPCTIAATPLAMLSH